MKKNKIILFDWGGIVEPQEEGFIAAFKKLFKKLGYDGNDAIDILKKYSISSVSTIEGYKAMFDEIKKEFNISCTFDEYLKKYRKIFGKIKYNKKVAKYEVSLKDKCYIGILSNLSIIAHDRIDKQLGLNNYDYVFLSYKLGCKKPDKKIYEKVQSALPFKPKDILFIDDLEQNIIPAKELGWNTLLASGKELDKIKKCCNEFLNEENE